MKKVAKLKKISKTLIKNVRNDDINKSLKENTEMMKKLKKSMDFSSVTMLFLTVILVIMTGVLIFLAIKQLPEKPNIEVRKYEFPYKVSGSYIKDMCSAEKCVFIVTDPALGTFYKIKENETYTITSFFVSNEGKSTENVQISASCNPREIGLAVSYNLPNFAISPPLINAKSITTLKEFGFKDLLVFWIINSGKVDKIVCDFYYSSNDVSIKKIRVGYDGQKFLVYD